MNESLTSQSFYLNIEDVFFGAFMALWATNMVQGIIDHSSQYWDQFIQIIALLISILFIILFLKQSIRNIHESINGRWLAHIITLAMSASVTALFILVFKSPDSQNSFTFLHVLVIFVWIASLEINHKFPKLLDLRTD